MQGRQNENLTFPNSSHSQEHINKPWDSQNKEATSSSHPKPAMPSQTSSGYDMAVSCTGSPPALCTVLPYEQLSPLLFSFKLSLPVLLNAGMMILIPASLRTSREAGHTSMPLPDSHSFLFCQVPGIGMDCAYPCLFCRGGSPPL